MSKSRRTLVTSAHLIDATGAAPSPATTIAMEAGRIVAIGNDADFSRDEAHVHVDAHGGYVIPGLMDANVHLMLDTTIEVLLRYENRYQALILEAAQIALKSGITSVFDTWGPLEDLLAVRDGINDGHLVGSRIFAGGNIVGLDGPLSADFMPPGDAVSTEVIDQINARWERGVGGGLLWLAAEDVATRVRSYIEGSTIDFVKYAGSGHGSPQSISFSERAQRAIVNEAHRAGLTAQGHTSTPESLRMEIDAGADLLQHPDITGLEPMPEDTLQTIVDRQIPAAAIITTAAHNAWSLRTRTDPWRTIIRVEEDNNRRLVAFGAKLLLTTDAGVVARTAYSHPQFRAVQGGVVDTHLSLGESHIYWFEGALAHGMSPMTALQSATKNIAEAYGVGADLGTIEVGKRADLLVLSDNPLQDHRNYRRIVHVIKDGEVVDTDALPTQRMLSDQS